MAFQKPHTTKAVREGHGEEDGVIKTEDRPELDSVKSDIADEDVNMDSDLEVHESAMDTKRAGRVVKGMDKRGPALANGKGELSIQSVRLESNY